VINWTNLGPDPAILTNMTLSLSSNVTTNLTSNPYQCGTILPGINCSVLLNVTILNNTPIGTTNWVNSTFTWANNNSVSNSTTATTQISVTSNPILNVLETVLSTSTAAGTSLNIGSFTVQSNGNDAITNINYSVSGGNIPSSWVSFAPPPNISSIAAGSFQSVAVTVTVPSGTANGNYYTNISVTSSNANSDWLWLNVSVSDWTISVSGGGPYANSGTNPAVTIVGNVTYANGTAISTPVNITITSGASTLSTQNVTSNSNGNYFARYPSGFAVGTYNVTVYASYGGKTATNSATLQILSATGANCQTQTISLSALAYDAATGTVITSGTAKLIIQETGDEKDVSFTNGIWSASFNTCLATGSTYHMLAKIVDDNGRSSSSILIFRAP